MEVLEKPKAKKKWSTQVICMGVQDVRIGCEAILKISEDDLFRVKVGNVGPVTMGGAILMPGMRCA